MKSVLLVTSEDGLAAARELADSSNVAIWCDARAISQDGFAKLKKGSVTRLVHAVDSNELVDDAIDTIVEHHPGCVVFVERSTAGR